jgi:hypothetical protein
MRSAIPLLAIVLVSCALIERRSSPHMQVSPSLPSTEAKVFARKTRNDNTSIEIRVKHLAPPDRLTPPGGTYVVWCKPTEEADPQNLGGLTVDRNENGGLFTITAFKNFELFITTEASTQVLEPSGEPLMWATVAR